jgi:hypothetical protein
MTPEHQSEVQRLRGKGYSLCYISACVDGVSYHEIEDFLGPEPHSGDWMAPALREWWMQQPWVWRTDNTNPIEAPWERISYEHF